MSPDRRRALFASVSAVALAMQPCAAQQQSAWMLPVQGPASPSGSLSFTPPAVINPTDPQWAGGMQTVGAAAVQNAVALQAAVNGACAAGMGAIVLPAQHFYVDTTAGEILINCDYVSIVGQGGTGPTLITWQTNQSGTPSTNNLFHVEPPSAGSPLHGGFGSFENLQVYRQDSPAGGDIVFCDHCAYEQFNHVVFQGGYHDLEIESSIYVTADPQSIFGGVESKAGSSMVWEHGDGSGIPSHNNASILLPSVINSGASNYPYTYDYPLVIQNTDGTHLDGAHIAWGRLGDLLVQPQYVNDNIDSIISTPSTYFDSNGGSCIALLPYGAVILTASGASGSGLTVTTTPPSGISGYSVNVSGYIAGTTVSSVAGSVLTLSNSVGAKGIPTNARVILYPPFTGRVTQNRFYGVCNQSAANAVQIDDPSVTFGGEISLQEFNGAQSAIDIEAGANYVVSGQYEGNNTSNGSWPTMTVGGNATFIQVPWISMQVGTGVAPPEHIQVTGQAQLLLGSSLFFAGTTTQVTNNSTNAAPGNMYAYSPAGSLWNVESWVGKPNMTVSGVATLTPAYATIAATGSTNYEIFGSGLATIGSFYGQASGAGQLDFGSNNNDATSYASPAAVATSTYSLLNTDSNLTFNVSGTCTLTLPAASTLPGRVVRVRTIAANAVNSATANVIPLAGGSASAAILAATAGKWAVIQSDGTNWNIIESN